jgi:hypothetical protein
MCPDTAYIYPQENEGPSWDRHRWQQFGILPDKWKATEYGGIGQACMLVVDGNDRRGNEGVWVSAADTMGATSAAKYGAHNGWHNGGAYVASDGSDNFNNENVSNDNTICVYTHGGQPGTTWDMYQIKASESSTTGGAQIGNRLAYQANPGLCAGKFSTQGPTPEMLRTYYKLIFFMAGDCTSNLGPFTNRSQNDVQLLTDFLTFGADENNPRGLWAMGDEFVTDAETIGGAQATFVNVTMAASTVSTSYFDASGSSVLYPDLLPTTVVTSGGYPLTAASVQNSCLWTNDVLQANVAVPGATVASFYENLGTAGPYPAGIYAPSTTGHPYVTLVDGWDLDHLKGRFGDNGLGRIVYMMNVLTNVFGSVCPFTPAPTVDVPQNTVRNVDFLGNVWGNPVVAGGTATVHFGLAKSDRVEVKVYDVTGRLVRSLADRTFQAGEHSLTWDGTSDQGRVVPRGVYFTQVKFINSGFTDAKKVTVLK